MRLLLLTSLQITSEVQGADMLRKIVEKMEETGRLREKEREECVRRETKAVLDKESSRKEEILSTCFQRLFSC